MRRMRKNNFLKKCIAMLLVVSLMGSQLLMPTNISFAADASQDVVIQETETTGITEITDTDSENNTGSADTTGDTDSADSSILSIESIEEVTNTSSSDESELSTGQTEAEIGSANESESETETEASAMSVTASLSADAASNTENTENEYQVSAAFTVSGSGEETVRLALCMDEITYSILLDSCATEPETAATDTCVLTLTDGTLLTTEKTVLSDGSIRLSFDYDADDANVLNISGAAAASVTGTVESETDGGTETAAVTATSGDATSNRNSTDIGTMTISFVLTAEAGTVEKDTLGTLIAAWCTELEEEEDAAWSELNKIRLHWNAVEDEPETETETESESETETEAETETETESVSETETETESEREMESGTETELESEMETETKTESESEIETETESETEAETETESFHTSVSARLLASAPALVSEEESDTETATESESETQETTAAAVDLTDYLTATDAKVEEGTSLISVSLSYSINTSVLQEAGTNIVEYQIPDNISAKKAYSGSVMDGDTVVGTYTISVDGLIQIVFDEDYVSGTPADIKGTISFWAKTSEEQVGEEGKMDIVFSDDHTIEVVIDKSLFSDYDVTVDKSCTSTVIDKENGTVTFIYSIEVTTDNGTGTTFDFEDVLSGSHYDKAEYSDLTVTKYSSNGSEVTGFGNTLSIVEGTASSNPSVSGTLASLEAGEKYVITYTVTRTLDDSEDSVTMSNSAKASNTYTADIDYSYNTASLYDLNVTKSSPDSPVLDRENGTVTNTYTVTVSTTMGTKGDIDLTDAVSFWPTDLDYTTNFKVASITKYTTDDSGEVTETKLELTTLDVDANGQLVGTLPELEAGEYYVIEYTLILSDLPSGDLVTFTTMNQVIVSDDFSTKYTYDNDYTTWVGSDYVNWVSKSGTYNASSNTITWTIVLNEGGYGDLDGLTLRDVLEHNGISVGDLADVSFTLTETKGYVTYPYYSYNNGWSLSSFTLKNGTYYTAWDNYSLAIDTTNEFTITYTTTVDTDNVSAFFNTYTNTATIGEHSDSAEVTIPLNTLDKEFTGSSAYTGTDYDGGYVLSWTTSIDVPTDGLAKGSTFTDTISDSSSKQANSKNWFTKAMLEKVALTIGGDTVDSSTYTVVCTGTDASGNAFTDKALSALDATDKVSSFQITFTDGISYHDGAQLLISYTSYSSTTDLAYNTGTYTEDGNSVSDEAAGKGDDGTLVSKYNADGTTTLKTELANLQDENLDDDPYLLTYKLIVNENNSAGGTITITDTLPEGTTLYIGQWKYSSVNGDGTLNYSDTDAFLGGVYFYYQPYDTKNYVYPYSNTSETTGRNAYLSSGYVYGGTATSYTDSNDGSTLVKVEYDDTNNQLTITIPEEVYKTTINGAEANYTMVLYYAVQITDPDVTFANGYEQSFSNSVTATDTDNHSSSDTVTNTVVASNVSKTGEYKEGTDTVEYAVYINPQAVTLLEGQQSTLTVKDTFSNAFNYDKWAYYVTDIDLVPGSLNLYKYENEEWGLCNEDILSSALSVYNYQAYLTVEVPDGAYYKLTYSYKLTFADWAETLLKDPDNSFSVTNSVKVEGLGSLGNSDSTSSQIEEGGSSAEAKKNYANITLYKRDSSNTTIMLEGAEFTLERFDGVAWETIYNGDTDTFVTDSSGSVPLGDKLSDGSYLISYNYLYRLRETKAPEGYKILSDYMYFYVQDDSSSTIVAPEGWETDYADYMLTVENNSYVVVENEQKDEGKTEFAIRKVWQDANGNTIDTPTDESESEITSITVDLYKTVNGTKTLFQSGITLSSANGWSTLVSDLPIYDGAELIYYSVEETDVPDGWAVSYTNNGNPIAADTANAQITVTNISSTGTVPATVNKVWLKSDGTAYDSAPEDSVDVTLKRSYSTGGSANSNNSETEYVTVTVVVEDKNNTGTSKYTSTLTQVVKGTQVVISIDSPGFNHLEGLTSFTYTDSESSATVGASYSWGTDQRKDSADNDIWVSCEELKFYATKNITVTIGNQWCEYTTDSFSIINNSSVKLEDGSVTDSSFEETVTLSSANNWSYIWAALPQYSSYDTEYTYWIEETNVPSGYYVANATVNGGNQVSATTGSDGSISCIVKNQRLADIDTTVTVKKKWQYYDADTSTPTSISDNDPAMSLLSSVTLELYRSTTTPTQFESEQESDPELTIPTSSELVDTVTISAGEDWTYTWEYLDKYYENNTSNSQYYYYVVEAGTGELYTVSYAGNGADETATTESKAGVSGTTADPIIVTNTVNTTKVTVTKTWVDRNGEVMDSGYPDSVQVQLYRKADSAGEEDLAYGDPVTLGTNKSAVSNGGVQLDGYSTDGWTYIWTNLLQGEYYVVEVFTDEASEEALKEAFTTSYYVVKDGDDIANNPTVGLTNNGAVSDAADALTSADGGTLVIYNQEIPVELTVTKVWGEGVAEAEVDIQLYRSTTRPSKSIKTVTVYKENSSGTQTLLTAKQISGDTVTLEASIHNWSSPSTPTLTCESDGKAVVSDAEFTIDSNDTSLYIYTFTISNLTTDCVLVLHTNDSYSASSITVTGSNGVPSESEIADDTGLIGKCSDAEKVLTSEVDDAIVTLSSGKNWTYTWDNLPRTDEDGNIYYYYVKEVTTGNYQTSYSYSYNEDGSIAGVIVLNSESLTTSVTVQKKWTDVEGTTKNPTSWSITLQLYRKNADGEWEVYALAPTKTITSSSTDAKVEWTDLPAGEYYVEEISMSGTNISTSTYTATYSTVKYDSQVDGDDKSDPAEATTMGGASSSGASDIYITNTEGSTEISVTKRWSDGSSNHKTDTVTMKLYSSTTDPATAESESQAKQGTTVTVYYAGSGWNAFTATGVVMGTAADIKICYSSYQLSRMSSDVLTSVYLLDSNGNKIYPIETETSGDNAYLVFRNVDISSSQYFTYVVATEYTSTAPEEYYPNTTSSYHEITDVEGSDYEFSTLINPVDSTSETEIAYVDLSLSNSWTYAWTDLPLTNENGETLYYYVEETTVANCATTYAYTYNKDGSISKVTVTNRPTVGNTDIEVVKKWTDVNGKTLTDISNDWSVTVQLYAKSSTGTWEAYKDANNKIVTLTLSNDNQWTGSFLNLPNGDYCVKEISMDDDATTATLVPENYTVYYQVGSQTATEDAESISVDSDATITITNAETPTSIEVTKVWKDENGNTLSDSEISDDLSVQMTLYSSTTAPDVVESGDSGTEYTVTVVADGYGIGQDLGSGTTKTGAVTICVKLYGAATDLSAWYLTDSNGAVVGEFVSYDSSNYTLTFDVAGITANETLTLYRETNIYPGTGQTTVTEKEVAATNPVGEYVSVTSALPTEKGAECTPEGTVTLSSANNWTYSWDTLSTHDSDGNQLYYYVVEGDCAGYTTSYEQYFREDGSIETVRVTNAYNASATEIGVTKSWAMADESSLADYEVTVRLWKHVVDDASEGTYKEVQVSGGADENEYTIKDRVLTASENWSGKWSGLEKLTSTDEYYYVTEVLVTDATVASGEEDITDQFLVTYSNNELSFSGTATITNTKKADISVTKQWFASDGTTALSESELADTTVSVSLHHKYTTSLNGTTVTVDETLDTISLGASNANAEVTTGDYSGKYDSTGWTYTWTSLPAGTYYVVENDVAATKYMTTYQLKEDSATVGTTASEVTTTNGTIVITNTASGPETIAVTVNKNWVYSDDNTTVTDEALLPESVTFELYYSTVSPDTLKSAGKTFPDDADLTAYVPDGNTAAETEVVTADSNGDWFYTWKDLPKYAADGTTLIYYYVKETCIDGTEITTTPVYENNGSAGDTGSNAITVTNTVDTTSVTVEKKWTDAGGTELDSSITSGYTVTVQLYQWDEDGGTAKEGAWESYGNEITLSSSGTTDSTGTELNTDSWTYTWTHLPAGKYYVEETGTTAKGGFTVSYHGSGMAETDPDMTEASEAAVEVTASDTGNTGSNSGTITVTNQKESTEISVEKIWKDSDGTLDTDQSETVTMYLYRTTTPLTEAAALQITSSVSSATYTSGSMSSTAAITCSGELSDFKSVTVDGVTLTEGSDYTLTSGSTIITFEKAYLETLSAGEHDVTLKYNMLGTIATKLYVKKSAETESETATESETQTETQTEKVTEAATESEKQTEKVTEATTESETQTEEQTKTESETATMDITIKVDWVDANGDSCDAPTEGYEWVGIHPYEDPDDSNTIDWNTNEAGNLSGAENWTATYTLPASLTENGVTTYYKYRVQYNSQICIYASDGTATVIGTVADTTQFDISGDGDAEQTYTITAVIADSSGSQTESETTTESEKQTETNTESETEKEGSWTVTLEDYYGTTLAASSVTSSSITVLVAFDWDAYAYCGSNLLVECDDAEVQSVCLGQTSTFFSNANWSSSNNYVVFKLTGISKDCTLVVNPSSAYPTVKITSYIVSGILTLEEAESAYIETTSASAYTGTLSASLIAIPHTLTTSGESVTNQTETEEGLLLPGSGVTSADLYATVSLGIGYANNENYDSTGLSYTWSNLDKYDENGKLYYYYIVEETANGYTTTYSNDVTITTTTTTGTQQTETTTTIDKVTVTNIKDATPISVTVEKEWNGYTETETDALTVTATLVRVDKDSGDETEMLTVELGAEHAQETNYSTDGWSYTRSGLDASYNYYFKEVSVKDSSSGETVANYSTSYMATVTPTGVSGSSTGTASAAILSQDGTITITNTKTSSQGITMPSTGSKYPLVFYGLGLSFLVASTTWMLYAFKKKKKYKYAGKGGAKPDSS